MAVGCIFGQVLPSSHVMVSQASSWLLNSWQLSGLSKLVETRMPLALSLLLSAQHTEHFVEPSPTDHCTVGPGSWCKRLAS